MMTTAGEIRNSFCIRKPLLSLLALAMSLCSFHAAMADYDQLPPQVADTLVTPLQRAGERVAERIPGAMHIKNFQAFIDTEGRREGLRGEAEALARVVALEEQVELLKFANPNLEIPEVNSDKRKKLFRLVRLSQRPSLSVAKQRELEGLQAELAAGRDAEELLQWAQRALEMKDVKKDYGWGEEEARFERQQTIEQQMQTIARELETLRAKIGDLPEGSARRLEFERAIEVKKAIARFVRKEEARLLERFNDRISLKTQKEAVSAALTTAGELRELLTQRSLLNQQASGSSSIGDQKALEDLDRRIGEKYETVILTLANVKSTWGETGRAFTAEMSGKGFWFLVLFAGFGSAGSVTKFKDTLLSNPLETIVGGLFANAFILYLLFGSVPGETAQNIENRRERGALASQHAAFGAWNRALAEMGGDNDGAAASLKLTEAYEQRCETLIATAAQVKF